MKLNRAVYRPRQLLLFMATLCIPAYFFFMTGDFYVQMRMKQYCDPSVLQVGCAEYGNVNIDIIEPHRTLGMVTSTAVAVLSIGFFLFLPKRKLQTKRSRKSPQANKP